MLLEFRLKGIAWLNWSTAGGGRYTSCQSLLLLMLLHQSVYIQKIHTLALFTSTTKSYIATRNNLIIYT